MENIYIIIITSLISGLLATILTIICQRIFEIKRSKREIFEILMSHRYLIHDKDNVEALNKIDVVFYKDIEVRNAWKEFLATADLAATNPTKISEINDKYLTLLEKIAFAIGYKKINWENIKKYYLPNGLSTQILEESALRKVQIKQATQISSQDKSTGTKAEELGMQFILKALDSPNGMDMISKLIELGKKPKK